MHSAHASAAPRRWAAMLAAAAVCLAACGEDERERASAGANPTPTSTPAAKTIDPSEWERRMVGFCERHAVTSRREALETLREGQRTGQSKDELLALTLNETRKAGKTTVETLERLPLPAGREELARRFTAVLADVTLLAEFMAKAVRQRKIDALRSFTRQLRPQALEARALARQLGVEECNPPRPENR